MRVILFTIILCSCSLIQHGVTCKIADDTWYAVGNTGVECRGFTIGGTDVAQIDCRRIAEAAPGTAIVKASPVQSLTFAK